MDITLERSEFSPFNYNNVTVRVRDNAILTLVTHNGLIAFEWLKGIQKSSNTRVPNFVVVGLCGHREIDYSKRGLNDSAYNVLQLCVGSQCLLYHFSDPDSHDTVIQTLRDFFSDSSVRVVGMKMRTVVEKLDRDYGIIITNYHDLNRLAENVLNEVDGDIINHNLDQLLEKVFDGRMNVERPQVKVEWFEGDQWLLSDELVKHAVVEPNLCFRIGTRLLELIEFPETTASKKEKKKEEEKKARKKKDKEEKKAKKKKEREMTETQVDY